MTHSVRKHLRLEIDSYDETIRRWIPAYEEMLQIVATRVAALGPALVLDLGAGTGALSEVILQDTEVRSIELIDVDAEMLTKARMRLQRFEWRALYRERSFHDELPSCDAIVAQIALHHVKTLDEKRVLYGRIHDALWSGGLFVNADCTIPADPDERDAAYSLWAAHMAEHGIEEEQAYAHLDEWAEEDTYFPLEDELAAMRDVGFDAECVWQEGPMSVVVGRKG